ncbi:MAG: alpha/beta fold hydrolase [Planctomycetaceae bacterium]|nr:alpha/beta fold hydrolase [Planctomycetaceae bacterium]
MALDFPNFRPHPLIRGGHLQTILGCYLPWKRMPYQAVQHLVPLPDGDKIVLHDDQPAAWHPGDGVVLMVHGLGGCHRSGYMLRGAAKQTERGYRVFRMDLRGCGAGFPHARHPTHAGRSDDALAALRFVMDQCPRSPVHVVGFSMGANHVLKMAGELAGHAPPALHSLMAVCPPIDLIACSVNIELRGNRIYDRSFVSGLMRQIKRRQRLVPGALTRPLNPRPRRLYEFDTHFTAPLAGYADARDYYTRASSGPLLKHITVPTLIVTAASDPIIPVGPFERASYSPTTQLVITPCGGHLGFIGRAGLDPDRRWLDWRILDWIGSHAPRPKPAHPVPPPHARPAVRRQVNAS